MSKRIITAITAAVITAALIYALGAAPMLFAKQHVVTQVR